MLLALMAAGAQTATASDFIVDGIDYNISSADDKTVVVTWSSSKYTGDIVIPEAVSYDGVTYKVVGIGDFAFIAEGITSIKLPESLLSIGTGAFANVPQLTSVDIPDGVKSIGNGCFSGCAKLEKANIPSSLESMGMGMFTGTLITSAVIPVGINEVPAQTFESCYALEKVTLHEGITSFGFQAFQNTRLLSEITLPSTLETIGNNCFAFSGLTSMHIPAALKSYGDNAITNMSSLTAYTVDPANNYFTAVDGVLYSKDLKTLQSFPLNCGLDTYTVNSVTDSIADYAFYGNKLNSIRFPEDLRAIGKSALATSASITTLTIPDKVTVMGPYSIFGCAALKEIELGASLRTIGSSAFDYTDNLMSVRSRNTVPPTGASFTQVTYTNGTLSVPADAIDDYKSAAGWSEFNNISSIGNSSVGLVQLEKPEICVTGNTIEVKCSPDTQVEIWGLDGVCIHRGTGNTFREVESGKIYVVRAGATISKVSAF